jgi:hypothetical protein
MHKHDIEKGYHQQLRKYGLPIITAGETSSPYFVERFYSMISRFNCATSNMGGSELFYCEELGVKYFIMGKKPMLINFADIQTPKGMVVPIDVIDAAAGIRKDELFCPFPPDASEEKVKFVDHVLGLDLDIKSSRAQLRNYLFSEYFRHLPEIAMNISSLLFLRFKPNCLKDILRRLYLLLGRD